MRTPLRALRAQQRGISFFGLVFLAAFLVAAFAIGSQSVPILLEYQAVSKAARKAAMEGNSVVEVRNIFDRAREIDDIRSISGKDLDVTKVNDRIVVGYKYERDIALFGPAYLVYRFDGKTR